MAAFWHKIMLNLMSLHLEYIFSLLSNAIQTNKSYKNFLTSCCGTYHIIEVGPMGLGSVSKGLLFTHELVKKICKIC